MIYALCYELIDNEMVKPEGFNGVINNKARMIPEGNVMNVM
jgi:hypothetical protein